MRCPDCRKKQLELTTPWERFRFWMFRTLFVEEYADLTQEKYTQGFGDGYKTGFEQAMGADERHVELVSQKLARRNGKVTPYYPVVKPDTNGTKVIHFDTAEGRDSFLAEEKDIKTSGTIDSIEKM